MPPARSAASSTLAKRIPGKEEFHETLRYFRHLIAETGVDLHLDTQASADMLAGYDEIVLATGIAPRRVDFWLGPPEGGQLPRCPHWPHRSRRPGRDHRRRRHRLRRRRGLWWEGPSPSLDPARWRAEWGVDVEGRTRGGLAPPRPEPAAREVWLLQRSPGRPGARLGRTTGWIHRATLKAKGVKMLGGVEYLGVDDTGLHIRVDGAEQRLPAGTVVVCAG